VLQRLPIIGVCGGGTKLSPERSKLVHDTGVLIGRLGAHLLVSASFAVAEATAEGFSSVPRRRGVSLANIARDFAGAFDKASCANDGAPYPSRLVELAMLTTVPNLENPQDNLGRSRVNILTADAVIVFPESAGTRTEAQLVAASRGEVGRMAQQKCTLLVGPAEEFSHELRNLFVQVPDAGAADAHLCRELSERGFFLTRAPL
jgi:hypothetical protein